jgi:hypothetical protein
MQGAEAAVSSGEALFFGDAPGLWPAYLALRGEILGLFPQCEVRVHKTQVSFRAPHPFVWVWRMPGRRGRESFFFTFATETGDPLPHDALTVFVRAGRWTRHLAVKAEGPAAGELAEYIKTSFSLRNTKGGKA